MLEEGEGGRWKEEIEREYEEWRPKKNKAERLAGILFGEQQHMVLW